MRLDSASPSRSDGVADLDTHIERQIIGDAAYDRHLLSVLLAEEGRVGLDDVEQLHNYGCHAREVAGAVDALELPSEGAGIDPRDVSIGIHLLGARREDDVDLLVLRER